MKPCKCRTNKIDIVDGWQVCSSCLMRYYTFEEKYNLTRVSMTKKEVFWFRVKWIFILIGLVLFVLKVVGAY